MFLRRSLSLLAATSFLCAQATHIVGGELFYDHLGGSQYQVTLKLYRDCTGIAFDATAAVGVFNADGSLYATQTLTFPGAQNVPIVLDSPCLTLPPNLCVETTSYVGIFDLPPTVDGYILSYQRCCRTGIINNLQNPGDLGLTVTTRVPGQSIASNSSPRFNELPPIALCLNAPLSFDHSATDPDGDSLVYALCTPFNGGTALDPQPNPPTAPPYAPVTWLAPYTEGYPIDSDPAIAVDPATGLLTLTPNLQGNFTIGVLVQEYRNGVLLNETRRDFLFKVVACDAVVTAGIQPQTEFCQDLTMNFSSGSAGAVQYHWDFGVEGIEADTANTTNPSWTFTEPGTYNVTLIANPGTTCADTTTSVFNVYLSPEPFITTPPFACGNLPVTLLAEGTFGANANLQWQLGAGSQPTTANTPEVTVQFADPGDHEVSLLVAENGCTGFYSTTISNAAQPVAGFSVTPASPQLVGVPVTFTDGSAAPGGAIDSWWWTIDDTEWTSDDAVASWTTPWPGTYHITLVVTTAQGCADTTDAYYVVIGGPLTIPNVFSPNGDGNNETFHIINVDQYNNDLYVYNRWGSKVYTSRNYKNQWDGDGVPDGTYYYVLRIDDGREFSGHVTLLR